MWALTVVVLLGGALASLIILVSYRDLSQISVRLPDWLLSGAGKVKEPEVFVEFYSTDVYNASSFPEYEYVKHRPSVGICFSGGGSRSFEATLGYLRGLMDTELLKNVRYTSSVSGGSWANAVFSFHDDSVAPLEELLGSYTSPEHITMEKLKHISPKSARGYPVRADLIANIAVELLLKNTVPDDIWVRAIHETFLRPAGIAFNSIPAWTRDQAAKTLSRNAHLLDQVEFRIPCSGNPQCDHVPFPIINSAMLGPIEAAPFGLFRRRYVMMESTPMYTGFPKVQNVTYPGPEPSQLALGGLVEPLGFGSYISSEGLCGLKECSNKTLRRIPMPRNLFSIANMTATSSWAPAALVAEDPLLKPLDNVLITVPYFSPHWGGATKDVFVGDGADMENQGLIALLRRGLKSICMFVNTPTALADRADYNPFMRLPKDGDLDGSLAALFGMLKIFPEAGSDLSRDQVFRRIDFPKVVHALQMAQSNGKGAVARLPLVTVENKWWGIRAGHQVDVTFVYLGRVYEWEEKLKPEIASVLAPNRSKWQSKLLPQDGMFKGFPHISVSQLHLTAPLANALADMSAWVIHHNQDIFKKALSDNYID